MNNNTTNNGNNVNVAIATARVSMRHHIRISIVSAQDAFSGVGRHVCKCPSCGGIVTHKWYVKIEGMTGHAGKGHARYIGLECFLPIAYHNGKDIHTDDGIFRNAVNVNLDGTNNTTKHRMPHVSVEFECVSRKHGTGLQAVLKSFGIKYRYDDNGQKIPYIDENADFDFAFMSVYVRLLFIGYSKSKRTSHIEQDCTVSAEGHVRFRSLQGLSKFLSNCTDDELKCFDDVRCGAHMHASCDFARERWCGRQIFGLLFERIQNMTTSERVAFFGSDFRGYASNDIGGHGCCINYRTAHNTIEIRLTRIHSAHQFVRVCKFWRGCIACINDNGHKINRGIWSTERLARLIAHQLDNDVIATKYEKGC